MSIFDSEDMNISSQNTELEKALEAGYGTDAATYASGRSLQREDLEATLVTILDVNQEDCKVFHKLHKQPVSSTVHQVEVQNGVGSEDYLFVGEGERATEDDPNFKRKIYETKYMSSKWQVSHPATLVNGVENPINAQKVSAVLRVTKGTEKAIFSGDSSIDPKQYDGMVKIIRDSAKDATVTEERLRATRMDIRGLEIGESDSDLGIDAGEALFDEIAEKVYNKGGDLKEAYFPPVLARQFKAMYSDRLRFTTKDSQFTLDKLPNIVTAVNSTIKITDDCGADKMFKVKGEIAASGDVSKRPATVSTFTASTADSDDSQFTGGHVGNYIYTVHAINSYGTSPAKALNSAVAVASGKKVTLEITPNQDSVPPTGYIICRSNADGSKVMEMVRIPANGSSAVTYVDNNQDLPGTASIVLLTPSTAEMKPNISFAQLMGISNFDLPTDSSLAHRGVVALYGMLEMRVPEQCAIIDNVGYAGGLY